MCLENKRKEINIESFYEMIHFSILLSFISARKLKIELITIVPVFCGSLLTSGSVSIS